MRTVLRYLLILACAVVLLPVLLFTCSGRGEPIVSYEVDTLREVIHLPDEITSARWEIVEYPEDSGFLATPDTYTVLVAELASASAIWPPTGAPITDHEDVVQNAARPWLKQEDRTLLTSLMHRPDVFQPPPNCHRYRTTMTKSGRSVPGFLCTRGKGALLYLWLDVPPEAREGELFRSE